MHDPVKEARRKNAEHMREIVATVDDEQLERFMAQYCRAASCEELIKAMPGDARDVFLDMMVQTYRGRP